MEDEEKLKEHPVKLYRGWVHYCRSITNSVDFPIVHVNRFLTACSKLFIDEYNKADEKRKKILNEKIAEVEKKLIDEKYLPDPEDENK